MLTDIPIDAPDGQLLTAEQKAESQRLARIYREFGERLALVRTAGDLRDLARWVESADPDPRFGVST